MSVGNIEFGRVNEPDYGKVVRCIVDQKTFYLREDADKPLDKKEIKSIIEVANRLFASQAKLKTEDFSGIQGHVKLYTLVSYEILPQIDSVINSQVSRKWESYGLFASTHTDKVCIDMLTSNSLGCNLHHLSSPFHIWGKKIKLTDRNVFEIAFNGCQLKMIPVAIKDKLQVAQGGVSNVDLHVLKYKGYKEKLEALCSQSELKHDVPYLSEEALRKLANA